MTRAEVIEVHHLAGMVSLKVLEHENERWVGYTHCVDPKYFILVQAAADKAFEVATGEELLALLLCE